MKIKEALQELELIAQKVKPLYDNLDNLEQADGDLELDFIRYQIRQLEDSLYNIIHTNNYLKRPVVYEGILFKNENDRYEIEGTGHELTSGTIIEYLHHSDHYDEDYWIKATVEHYFGDYCIVIPLKDGGNLEKDMNGLKVRVR